jgi:hypothetical protein
VGARNSFQTTLASWNPEYRMQLFSNHLLPSEDLYFSGAIHQVSLYDQALGEEEIRATHTSELDRLEQEANSTETTSNTETTTSNTETTSPASLLHLVASAFKDATLVQGRTDETSIWVGGWNASTTEWTVMVEIVSLPSFGSLQQSLEGPIISSPGARIPLLGNATRTPLVYRTLSEDFFNVPSSSFHGIDLELNSESFEYRLVALNDDNTVVGSSEYVTQPIHVVHVNHPPVLKVSNRASISDDQPTGFGTRPKAHLGELTVLDQDFNIDRVRVDVWATNGTLTLPEAYRQLTDFESCADRTFSAWQCHGRGEGADRNMTFVAEPSDVSLILSNLEYNGFFWDQQDEIVVRIWDGSGGSCLDEQEHESRFFVTDNFFDTSNTFYTIHEGCYKEMAVIEVPAISMSGGSGSSEQGLLASLFDFNDFGLPDVIFWVAVVFVLTFCCMTICACRRCVRRLTRGVKIQPDDINYVQDVVADPQFEIVDFDGEIVDFNGIMESV